MCTTTLDNFNLLIYGNLVFWKYKSSDWISCRFNSTLCNQNLKNLTNVQKEHFIDKQLHNPTLLKYFSIAMNLVVYEKGIEHFMNPFCNHRKERLLKITIMYLITRLQQHIAFAYSLQWTNTHLKPISLFYFKWRAINKFQLNHPLLLK